MEDVRLEGAVLFSVGGDEKEFVEGTLLHKVWKMRQKMESWERT